MNKTQMISLGLLGALLLGGCAQRELVFTQDALCQSPIANIHLQSVYKKEGHSTTSEIEFKKDLETVIKNTGCIRLVNSPKDDAFTLNATYEVNVQNQAEKTTFKTKTNNILHAKVILNLSNQEIIRRDYGESKIAIEENKVLGIGENEQISQEDEEKALKSSILAALKSFIAAMQAKQNTQDPSQESLQ
ncbi:hypothetical protein [Helicobacter pametensis]|uniref:hypothetical protein n=1 Tax=Helicobacter pametensis TaxID=95149 RepID=UPI000485574A|nr:hypothetical protein [Helicobacter pametensis]